MIKKSGFILLSVFFLMAPVFGAEAWQQGFKAALKNGGALVVEGSGRTVFAHRAEDHFIPASTIKVATAAAALHHWGRDFRFVTEFYLTGDGRLAVRGLGDPSITSEEFPKIVAGLKQAGVTQITGIFLDDSFFAPGILIDGAGKSTDPYNALNGALVANYNTVFVTRLKNGQVVSAETQTPLTPTAVARAKQLGAGRMRVNLGSHPQWGTRYFGELLAAFLKKGGVTVLGGIELVPVPSSARQVYVHRSSKPLEEVVRGLLEYSTNFMSNQLFLILGASVEGGPATVAKGSAVLTRFLREQVGWQDFTVADGAGLSRQNQVTPKQMLTLLDYFVPNRDLMPAHFGAIYAKTGTLTGVNTLVGYFDHGNELVKFALLVNAPVPYDYKFQLAKKLYLGVTGHPVPKSK